MKRNLGQGAKHDLSDALHRIAEENASEHPQVGYVLITCEGGSLPANLNVRMTYQGDPFLISYLLESSSSQVLHDAGLEEEMEMEEG